MKPEYILLICAGGVLFLMLFIYFIVAVRTFKIARREDNNLTKSYSDENLQKMEYDVAFYDKNSFTFGLTRQTNRQVTIDDLLTENKKDAAKVADEAVFSQIEDKGIEEIKGTYNPAE